MGKMKIGKSPRKDGLSRKVHVSGSPVQVTRFPRKKKPVYTRKFNNKESKKRSKCEGCECYTFIEKIEVEKYAQEVYGPKVDYSDTYLHCPSCGHDKQSTANSSGKAKAKAKSESVIEIMKYLEEWYSVRDISEALDVPTATVSSWKNVGNATGPSLVLLRIIRTYPWIIKVADSKFEKTFAQREFVFRAIDKIMQLQETLRI